MNLTKDQNADPDEVNLAMQDISQLVDEIASIQSQITKRNTS